MRRMTPDYTEHAFDGRDGSPVSAEDRAESARRIAEAERLGDQKPSWEALK